MCARVLVRVWEECVLDKRKKQEQQEQHPPGLPQATIGFIHSCLLC